MKQRNNNIKRATKIESKNGRKRDDKNEIKIERRKERKQ